MTDSSFVIRPSSMRKSSLLRENTEVWKLGSDEIEEEFMQINVLTEDKLRVLAQTDNLDEVIRLELRVDCTDQSISELGEMLPNLEELVLTKSVVSTFREFGTKLRNLCKLHLGSSFVRDLDGISALDALAELYLPFNNIKSLTPLAMHENLEILDLRGNMISNLNEIDQLGTCFKLKHLILQENPVSQVEPYRALILHYIPQLESLDGIPISESDRASVNEVVIDRVSRELEEFDEQTTERSYSIDDYSNVPASTSDRPNEVLLRARPSTPRESKTNSSSSTGKLEMVSSTASPRGMSQSVSVAAIKDDHDSAISGDKFSASSELTHGSNVVFAGNLAASMRRRKLASKLQNTEQRLKQVAERLREENAASPVPEDDASQSSGCNSARHLEEDDDILNQLNELMELSSGLEKEYHQLQSNEHTESPKSKLIRRRKDGSTSSRSSSSTTKTRTTRPKQRTNNDEEAEKELKQSKTVRSSSAGQKSRPSKRISTSTEESKTSSRSSLKTSWKPSPPPRKIDTSLNSHPRLSQFVDDLGDDELNMIPDLKPEQKSEAIY